MNGSRSVLRRGVVVGCLLVSLALPAWAAPASAPKEEPPVIRVGAEEVSSREMLQVLGMNVGGNEMALGMALYQMDRKAREEFARQLAHDGVNLVLIARNPQPLEETATSCREIGVEVRTVARDAAAAGGAAANYLNWPLPWMDFAP